MNQWQKTFILISVLALAPFTVVGDHEDAGERFGPGGPRGDDVTGSFMRHFGHALRELDLDEGQREHIRELMLGTREELHANHMATTDGMRALRGIVTAETLDPEALAEAAASAGQLAEERVLITGTTVHAVLAELSDAQRDQLRAMGEERRGRYHRRD